MAAKLLTKAAKEYEETITENCEVVNAHFGINILPKGIMIIKSRMWVKFNNANKATKMVSLRFNTKDLVDYITK